MVIENIECRCNFFNGNHKNRKLNIGIIKPIEVMADTTISVSDNFHNWLKSKGKKGENYEDIIKRFLKPEFTKEFENFRG